MPYKSKEERRAWETSPAQQVKGMERKQRQRDRQNQIELLQAVQALVDRVGHDRFIGPGLRQKLKDNQVDIRKFHEKRDKEQVIMSSQPVRDEESWSRTQIGGEV